MDSFDIIGQAHLDAAEGQRLIAAAAARWIKGALVKLVDAVGRNLPQGSSAPW